LADFFGAVRGAVLTAIGRLTPLDAVFFPGETLRDFGAAFLMFFLDLVTE
jgi:hypothetical protein